MLFAIVKRTLDLPYITMDVKEYRLKLFQQQVFQVLHDKDVKTSEYDELRLKSEALDKELADTLIRMSVLKLEIKDLEKKLNKCF